MKSNSVGFQLPGGPFVQVGHMQETCWSSYHQDGPHGQTTMHFECSPHQMLEQADTVGGELGGAMRDQANRALDFKAELQELTRG